MPDRPPRQTAHKYVSAIVTTFDPGHFHRKAVDNKLASIREGKLVLSGPAAAPPGGLGMLAGRIERKTANLPVV